MGESRRPEEAADGVAAYMPHRPRPADPSGLRRNLRLREGGRLYWHWDPNLLSMSAGRSAADMGARTQAAAASIQISTLLVRGALSEIVDEAGVEDFRRLMPHAELVDVAEAGHMVAGDRNDAFNDAIPEVSGKTDGRRAVTPVPVAAAPSLVFSSLADAAGT